MRRRDFVILVGVRLRQSPSQLIHSNRRYEGKTFCPLLAKRAFTLLGE
jgi:hypothetical protein